MNASYLLKLQDFINARVLLAVFFTMALSQNLLASQVALVTADEAIIYSDVEMTAPVGFVAKGKKIQVGEIARNKGQVYPIIVSGKIAYIKVSDISTELLDAENSHLLAERFSKQTQSNKFQNSFGFSYLNYASQISMNNSNGGIENKDSLNWSGLGLSLSGMFNQKPKWEVQLLLNYLAAKEGEEKFKMLETGFGVNYRFLDASRFVAKLQTQLLAIPWASYAYGSDFRVNSAGLSAGLGLGLYFRLTERWGIDAFGGAFYTKTSGFNSPSPYSTISPAFVGTRMSLGLNYVF
jgi:hypothetical protein